jgi:tetratricopeptide (TPR) repeat protein/transcriptional regulator with XRE-family HTH domain
MLGRGAGCWFRDSTGMTAKRERFVQRRKALGLTQEALAELLSVERSTVIRWERGASLPLPWIWPKLAKALQISRERLEELLDSGSAPGHGGDRSSPTATFPRQLPAAVPNFTGRVAELETLTRMLDQADGGAAGTVVISAIGGTAGVGKTALALHWAHQVAHQFPDGQLYVNLRGFDPSGVPVTQEDAIRGFLDVIGVPPERIPATPDARERLYRSLLADRRMLVVLDNARDEQQVRPLLPAGSGTLVLVTSRNQLGGLAAADGARLVSLDVLTHDEATQMLTGRIGAARSAAEPEAVAEIAALCACLPLALAVAAARAAARPSFPLSALAAELRDTAARLDALDSGDAAGGIPAVFSWSYRQLSSDGARMFRLLGLHPGPDISAAASASLAGAQQPMARRLLGELTRAHMITESGSARYGFHDLLRAFAASQARDCDSEPERKAAVGRVLDHYLHTAHTAVLLLYPPHERVDLGPPRPGVLPEPVADHRCARAWFEAEHRVLLAVAVLAVESGSDRHAWQIPWVMMPYLQNRGYNEEWASTQRIALAAANRLRDIKGLVVSSRLLAGACSNLGDYDEASSHLGYCLTLYRQLGDRFGEAKVHQGLSRVASRQGRYTDALHHARQAGRTYQAIGHQAGEVEALNLVGWYQSQLGNHGHARACCRRALTLNAETGNRRIEAALWDSLGYAEHHLRNFAEAATCYQRALGIAREVGDRWGEAESLTHLGDTQHATGDLPLARETWEQAIAVLDDLGHADAGKVRAKIERIDS